MNREDRRYWAMLSDHYGGAQTILMAAEIRNKSGSLSANTMNNSNVN